MQQIIVSRCQGIVAVMTPVCTMLASIVTTSLQVPGIMCSAGWTGLSGCSALSPQVGSLHSKANQDFASFTST